MKMAKASERDIEAAGNFMSILDQIDRDDYPVVDADEVAQDRFDPDDYDHLRHFYDLIKSSLDCAPNWHGRVIGGMCYVILYGKNEILDPASDVLELHPRFQKMSDERAGALDLLKEVLSSSEQGYLSPTPGHGIDLIDRIRAFVPGDST